jgi:8-oxo-dGTP pyrophosphatase MutT (NUDIX family)
MGISPYYASLRARIGHDPLHFPAVTVLPVNDLGQVLLVRHAETSQWATIGGAIEPDEAPADAAKRETLEEAGVQVELTGLLAALGGPEYRHTYANGDEASFVSVVYAARVVGGELQPDGDETTEVAWHYLSELDHLDVGPVTRHLFAAAIPLLS